MKLGLLACVLDRVEGTKALIESFDNAGAKDSELNLLIGERHQSLYLNIVITPLLANKLTTYTDDKDYLVERYNELYNRIKGKYDYYMFCADDMTLPKEFELIIPTMESIIKKVGHRYIIAYGDDGIQGQNLPTHPIVTKELLELIGYFFPPCLHHCYGDNFWKRLGQDCKNIFYLPAFKIDHKHFIKQTGVRDKWMDRAYGPLMQQDKEAFERYLKEDYPAVRNRVRVAIER